jgi:hypothetical protein
VPVSRCSSSGCSTFKPLRKPADSTLSRRLGPLFIKRLQEPLYRVNSIDTCVPSTLKSSHRAPGVGEPLSKLDFELCTLMRSRRHPCHPGKHVTRQQTQCEPVRVMKNDRVIDPQVK